MGEVPGRGAKEDPVNPRSRGGGRRVVGGGGVVDLKELAESAHPDGLVEGVVGAVGVRGVIGVVIAEPLVFVQGEVEVAGHEGRPVHGVVERVLEVRLQLVRGVLDAPDVEAKIVDVPDDNGKIVAGEAEGVNTTRDMYCMDLLFGSVHEIT